MTKADIPVLDPMCLSSAQYMQQRVDNQLEWYSKKSAKNKRWYYRLQFITLLCAVSVPVITLMSGDIRVRIVVALLGAGAALAAGLLSMYQFKDQWLDYRSTAESLKFEKYLFLTRSPPYDSPTAFTLFVQRVEATILTENHSWRQKGFNLSQEPAEAASADEVLATEDDSPGVRVLSPDEADPVR